MWSLRLGQERNFTLAFLSLPKIYKLIFFMAAEAKSLLNFLKQRTDVYVHNVGLTLSHRITEPFRFEKTLRLLRSLSQTADPAVSNPPLNHFLSTTAAHVFNAFRDGDKTTSLSSLFQCLTTLVTIFFHDIQTKPPLAQLKATSSSCHLFGKRGRCSPCHNLLSGSCRERQGSPALPFLQANINYIYIYMQVI